MKEVVVLISILLATILFFPSSILARQLAEENDSFRKTPIVRDPKPGPGRAACGRGKVCIGPAVPRGSPKYPCHGSYKRNCKRPPSPGH